MKTETFTKTVERSRTRAKFLFNDAEFRPRREKNKKNEYKRKDKHVNRSYDFA